MLPEREREDAISRAVAQPESGPFGDIGFSRFVVYGANVKNQTGGTSQFDEGQPLSVTLRLFLGVSCKHPAEIGKPIEVMQDLRIEILLYDTERGNVSLCAPTCCSSKIQRGRNWRPTGHHPIFGI